MNSQNQKSVARNEHDGNFVSNDPVSRSGKPYESRKDWAVLYANCKRHDWMADSSGIVRLTATGALYWVNVWEQPGHFALKLKPKEGGGGSVGCRLWTAADHPERYQGTLLLSDEVIYVVTLWEDDQPAHLSIHFERSAE
jgi:hypothetical protein